MALPLRKIDRWVLIALIAFEAFAGYNFFCREVAWYPPGNFDQALYLLEAYRTKENILTNGLGQLVVALHGRYSNGVALPVLGAMFGLCFPGGRLPELLIGFLAFSLLQVVVFLTGQSVGRSRLYGYMLLGLVLCQHTAWYWAGGMFDFRFDFTAYSLYGIWVCLVIRGDVFLRRNWAIASGLVGGFLAILRFAAFVYLCGVILGFAIVSAIIWCFWRRDLALVRRMRTRITNVSMSGAIMATAVMPFLILNWHDLFEYYGVGHLLSNFKDAFVRQEGMTNLTDSLLFYPNSILHDHWRIPFVLGAAIVLLVSLTVAITRRRKAEVTTANGQREAFVLRLLFLLGATVGPVLVLTMDPLKNSCVGGIVGVPAALLLVVVAARATSVSEPLAATISTVVVAGSAAVFILGFGTVANQLSRHTPEYHERRDLLSLVELDKWMVNYASDHGWRDPSISCDVISPWFNGYSVTDIGYETMGIFVEFHPLLGNDIMGVDRQEALAQVARSEFFILTDATPAGKEVSPGGVASESSEKSRHKWAGFLGRWSPFVNTVVKPVPTGIPLEASTDSMRRWPASHQHLYPFYERLAQYRDDLKAWADKNMTLAQTMAFENFTVTLYVRSSATPSGLSRELRNKPIGTKEVTPTAAVTDSRQAGTLTK